MALPYIVEEFSKEKYTPKLTQDKSIFSVGTGKDESGNELDLKNFIVNGQISDVKIKGQTATNIIQNGNFANGINNWKPNQATLTIENGDCVVTFSATNTSTGLYQQNTNIPEGHEVYIQLKIKPLYADRLRIGFDPYVNLFNLLPNQWNTVGIKQTKSSSSSLVIYHDTSNYSIGETFRIKEVMLIDLTAHGLQDLTAEECNKKFPHWFNSTKSTVSTIRLASAGKNIFDKSKGTIGNVLNASTGALNPNPIGHISEYIKVLPSTSYCVHKGLNSGALGHCFYDSNKNYISGVVSGATEQTITTPANATFVRISTLTTNLDTQQLEKGTIATEYEPYKLSQAYINAGGELRSVGIVKDEIRDIP